MKNSINAQIKKAEAEMSALRDAQDAATIETIKREQKFRHLQERLNALHALKTAQFNA